MKKILFSALLFLCFFSGAANSFFEEDTTLLQKGRSLYVLLSARDGEALYRMMTPKFQTAVNGKEGFEKLMQQLPAQLGMELKVEEEATFHEAGFNSYYRISRFEKSPSVTTRFVWKDDDLHGLSVRPTPEPAKTEYADYKTKTRLQLPFQDTWYVAWGGREPHLNYHVSAPDQRFAYDFVYSDKGKISTDNPTKNEDYFGFGKPVYSPAGGSIVVAVDSVEDNQPGAVNSKSPPGNYVVIDHGNGEYSLLAHFKKGTIAVKNGSVVKEGDFLGQMGNSGQSTLPHLHYHLQTGKDYRQGVGLPAFFHNYKADDKRITTGEPTRGEYISPVK